LLYKKHAYKKLQAENWPTNKKHLRNMARLKFQKHKKWKKHEILVRTNFKAIQTIQTILMQKYQRCFYHPHQRGPI
jgi:hypothetical protein